jgi:putative endopeptidase
MAKKPYNILKNVDPKTRPQDDLWGYVNNIWAKKNPMPASYAMWRSFDILQSENSERLRVILQTLRKRPGRDPIRKKLADYYRSGMDERKLQREGYEPLLAIMRKLDTMRTPEDLIRMIAHLQIHGFDVLWGMLVGADDKNSSRNIFHIGQSGLGLPDRDYYLASDARHKKIRAAYAKHIAHLLSRTGLPIREAQKAADQVMRVETALARASWTRVELRDIPAQYNKLTLGKLSSLAPRISWKEYFKAIDVPLTHLRKLIVWHPSFLQGVDTLMRTMDMEGWRAYLRWHVVAESAGYLSESLAREHFRFVGTVLTGQKKMKPRWKRVASEVNAMMGEGLGKIYVEKHFPPLAKRKMDELVDNLIVAYRERIQRLPWMNTATRRKALAKLKAMGRQIGYPKKWEQYKTLKTGSSFIENHWAAERFRFHTMMRKLGKRVDRNEWDIPPSTVNAFYSINFNQIIFPAGILQPPFFDLHGSDAMNYGAIGAIIGHELTHGFDDRGSLFDAQGNLRKWWQPADRKRFEAKAARLVKQFDACTVIDDIHCNGKLTLSENIADLGGLAIAYDALQKARQKNPKGFARTQGLTAEQQFFIAYAHTESIIIRPEQLRMLAIVDEHSYSPLRVNITVSDMHEFYEAFDVRPGDTLYRKPKDRVEIW